jgi:hypothetical protein
LLYRQVAEILYFAGNPLGFLSQANEVNPGRRPRPLFPVGQGEFLLKQQPGIRGRLDQIFGTEAVSKSKYILLIIFAFLAKT